MARVSRKENQKSIVV